MQAEGLHELGRRGTLEAKEFLWRVLGEHINLPFNAYDHADKLTFDNGVSIGVSPFSFDLRGLFTRSDPSRFDGTDAAEVFVEVKNYQNGSTLLEAFASFLKKAAVVSLLPAHRDTWFLFVAKVPFGTTKGIGLCDGSFLRERSADWPEPLRSSAATLANRVAVIIATQSFTRLLSYWGHNA